MIEIWGFRPDGTRYRLNEFRSDNGAVTGSTGDEQDKLLEALRRKAAGDIHRWRGLYPDDNIKLVEGGELVDGEVKRRNRR